MFLQKDNCCAICSKVFCCANCRRRHENNVHVPLETTTTSSSTIAADRYECNICNGKSFILRKLNDELLIDHIVSKHLPLSCTKCSKMYTDRCHFSEIDLCNTQKTIITTTTSIKVEVEQKESVVSPPLSPPLLSTILENVGSAKTKITATSNCELRIAAAIPPNGDLLKAKPLEKSLTDSICMGGNNVYNKTASPKKLVRTTSTPMQFLLIHEGLKQQMVFDSSSCHLSSIASMSNNITPLSDSDSSPPSTDTSSYVLKKPTISKIRPKLPVAATPLRQLLSKSIQRAMAEHGTQRFPDFHSNLKIKSPSLTSPLDLRTTPVIRRTHSTGTTEIVSKFDRLGIRLTENEPPNNPLLAAPPSKIPIRKFMYESDSGNENDFTTPKLTTNPTANIKKAISFTSSEELSHCDLPQKPSQAVLSPGLPDEDSDVWFTPSTTIQRSYSVSVAEGLRRVMDKEEAFTTEDEAAFVSAYDLGNVTEAASSIVDETAAGNRTKNRFWSIVESTVERIKSFRGTKKEMSDGHPAVKRYASFSGYDNAMTNINESLKRRRAVMGSTSPDYSQPNVGGMGMKRVKIHGRRPINRMRNNNSNIV